MLQGLYLKIGLPLIFMALLASVLSWIFSQQHLSKALYAFMGAVGFTALLYSGETVMGWIQAAQGGN